MPGCALTVFGGAAKTANFGGLRAPHQFRVDPQPHAALLKPRARASTVGASLPDRPDGTICFRGVHAARVALVVASSSAATSSVDE